jgi:hypothetical protein
VAGVACEAEVAVSGEDLRRAPQLVVYRVFHCSASSKITVRDCAHGNATLRTRSKVTAARRTSDLVSVVCPSGTASVWSGLDDFEVIAERRRVMTALAALTDHYRALSQEISRRDTLQWMLAPRQTRT